MKLTIETKALREELHKLAATPTIYGITAVTVKADEFGGLELKRSTPLATMFLQRDAMVEEGGEMSVGFDALNSLLSKIASKELTITTDKSRLCFKAGTATASLMAWTAEDVPAGIREIHGMPTAFEGLQLKEWLSTAIVAGKAVEGRDNLKGVCVRTWNGRVILFGTDGRRINCFFGPDSFEPVLMAADDVNDFDMGVLLSKEVVQAVERLIGDTDCAVRLRAANYGAQFDVGANYLRFVIPVSGPPDISVLLKETPADMTFLVERKALLSIIKPATTFGAGEVQAITLRFLEGKVRVEGMDGIGNDFADWVPANVSKHPAAVRANGSFIEDFLSSSKSDRLQIEYRRGFHQLSFSDDNRFCTVALLRDAVIPPDQFP